MENQMTKIIVAALMLTLAPATAAYAADAPATPITSVVPTKGKMLIAADGARLAPIYRVASDGPQVILDGRMVTVPSNTLAVVDGKLETTLTKAQVIALP
jgi:hypothetical protein